MSDTIQVYGPTAAHRIIGCSVGTVHNMIEDGRLEVVYLAGGRRLISGASVDRQRREWNAKQQAEAAEAEAARKLRARQRKERAR